MTNQTDKRQTIMVILCLVGLSILFFSAMQDPWFAEKIYIAWSGVFDYGW